MGSDANIVPAILQQEKAAMEDNTLELMAAMRSGAWQVKEGVEDGAVAYFRGDSAHLPTEVWDVIFDICDEEVVKYKHVGRFRLPATQNALFAHVIILFRDDDHGELMEKEVLKAMKSIFP